MAKLFFLFVFSTFILGHQAVGQNSNSVMVDNPLLPYMIKKNGKIKRKFQVPFSVLKKYYEELSQGAIVENTDLESVLDLDLRKIENLKPVSVDFIIKTKKQKAYPVRLISPDSVSRFFVLDAKKYMTLVEADDFLSAKVKLYNQMSFDSKKASYAKSFIYLDDWRSLNHPPVRELGEDLTIWDKSYSPLNYEEIHSDLYEPDFQKKIDSLSESELSFGNQIQLLANGDSYKKKLTEVVKAKSSILMAVMSFVCDKSSKAMEDALIEKVKQGVDVKLIVEKVWTKAIMKKCMNRMVDAGVDVVYSNDFAKSYLKDDLFHNKFLIIDGARAIIGGSNIVSSDNLSTGFNHLNRDNDIFITGPVVSDMTLGFTQLWRRFEKTNAFRSQLKHVRPIFEYETQAMNKKKNEALFKKRGSTWYNEVLLNSELRNTGVCRFVTQGPQNDENRLSKVFIELMQKAQNQINLTTGSIYFDLESHSQQERERKTWNKKLFNSIFSAAGRGVKIDLIGNGIDGGYGEVSNTFNQLKIKSRYETGFLRTFFILF